MKQDSANDIVSFYFIWDIKKNTYHLLYNSAEFSLKKQKKKFL